MNSWNVQREKNKNKCTYAFYRVNCVSLWGFGSRCSISCEHKVTIETGEWKRLKISCWGYGAVEASLVCCWRLYCLFICTSGMLTVRRRKSPENDWLMLKCLHGALYRLDAEREWYCSQCWWCEVENVDETIVLWPVPWGQLTILGCNGSESQHWLKCLILFHFVVSGLWGTDEVQSMCMVPSIFLMLKVYLSAF